MPYVSHHVGWDFQASEFIDHNEIITEDMSHITVYPGGLITKGIDIEWQLSGVGLHLCVWPNSVCLLWVSDGQQTHTCIRLVSVYSGYSSAVNLNYVYELWIVHRWKHVVIYSEWHCTCRALLSSFQFLDSSPVVLILSLPPAGPSKITAPQRATYPCQYLVNYVMDLIPLVC